METEVAEHELDDEMEVNDWKTICQDEQLSIEAAVDSDDHQRLDIGEIRADMKVLRKVLKCQRLQLRNAENENVSDVQKATMLELFNTFKHYSQVVSTKMEKFLTGGDSDPPEQGNEKVNTNEPLGDNPDPLWDYEPDGHNAESPNTLVNSEGLDGHEGQSLGKIKPIYVNDEEGVVYWCPLCEFKRKSQGAVYTHLTKAHNIAPFKCRYCRFTSGNKHSIHNHELRHLLKN